MKPGRELDALIAEKVMGLKAINGSILTNEGEGYTSVIRVPPYSTDIATAWEVVEKLKLLLYPRDKGWVCAESDPEQYIDVSPPILVIDGTFYSACEAGTAPLAICIAALKAVGHES